MTWHLKDRELEKALEKYSDGNFVKALNFAIERDWIDAENVVTVEFERKFLSRDYTNDLSFRTDELEDIPEYNPKAWNNYPTVTPPEGIWMRFETKVGEGFMAVFEDGDWFDCNGQEIDKSEGRFRPWED